MLCCPFFPCCTWLKLKDEEWRPRLKRLGDPVLPISQPDTGLSASRQPLAWLQWPAKRGPSYRLPAFFATLL